MESRTKVLWIRDIIIERSGRTVFVAEANNGSDICVGDVFTVQYDSSSLPDEDFSTHIIRPAPTNLKRVELMVSAIEWPFRGEPRSSPRSDMLPHGHYGALCFKGAGLETLTPGCYLES